MARPYNAANDPIRLGLESLNQGVQHALDRRLRERQLALEEKERAPIDVNVMLAGLSPEERSPIDDVVRKRTEDLLRQVPEDTEFDPEDIDRQAANFSPKEIESLAGLVKGYREKQANRAAAQENIGLAKGALKGLEPGSDVSIGAGGAVGIRGVAPKTAAEVEYEQARAEALRAKAERDKAQIGKSGKLLPAAQGALYIDGQSAMSSMPEVLQTIEKNKDIFGPVRGRAAAVNPYDERGQTINSQIGALRQVFGRFMEGGVLRKEDETKYEKMLPTLSDTPGIAKNKLANAQRLLAKRASEFKNQYEKLGYDTSDLDEIIAWGAPKALGGRGGAGGGDLAAQARAEIERRKAAKK